MNVFIKLRKEDSIIIPEGIISQVQVLTITENQPSRDRFKKQHSDCIEKKFKCTHIGWNTRKEGCPSVPIMGPPCSG